jgi:prepilin peptidase CpaA
MLAFLALAVFAGLLIYAACTDIASLTIPNWVSIALSALFIVFALAQGMPLAEIGVHVLFGFGVLVIGFFLFQANIIGGGDAKLLGAAAVWTGFAAFAPFLIWTAIAGGVLAAILLVARMFQPAVAAWAPPFVYRLLTPNSGLPYGVAIMIGGLMAAPALPLAGSALTLL